MNRTELVAQLGKKTGLSEDQCLNVINALFGTRSRAGLIEGALYAKDRVVIYGFGKFYTRIRPAYEGCNPVTGKKIEIPSKVCVYFKAGKTLRDRVAEAREEGAIKALAQQPGARAVRRDDG